MRPFELAVVGTDGVTDGQAVDLARLRPRARISAAVDADADRLASFGNRWQVDCLYRDLAALLLEQAPDLVYVRTPPPAHAQQVLICLRRGLTVLVDSPPARSLAEFDALLAQAAPGARLAAAFRHRFGSGAGALRRVAASGRFGRTVTAACNTLWYRADSWFRVPQRGRWNHHDQGAASGHGIHQLDLLLAVLGPWAQVSAVAGRGPGDLACAVIGFEDGGTATVTNSLLSPRETSYLRVDFEYATVELEHQFGGGEASWTVLPVGGREALVGAAWQQAVGRERWAGGQGAQLAAVLDALRGDTAPPVSPAQARASLELLAAGYASISAGRPVRRGEIGPGHPFYTRTDGTLDSPPAPAPAVAGDPPTGAIPLGLA